MTTEPSVQSGIPQTPGEPQPTRFPLPANPYEALDVTRDADSYAIEAAYQYFASEYHPGRTKHPGLAECGWERYIKVQHAYRILRNPSERQRYDEAIKKEEQRIHDWEHAVAQSLPHISRINAVSHSEPISRMPNASEELHRVLVNDVPRHESAVRRDVTGNDVHTQSLSKTMIAGLLERSVTRVEAEPESTRSPYSTLRHRALRGSESIGGDLTPFLQSQRMSPGPALLESSNVGSARLDPKAGPFANDPTFRSGAPPRPLLRPSSSESYASVLQPNTLSRSTYGYLTVKVEGIEQSYEDHLRQVYKRGRRYENEQRPQIYQRGRGLKTLDRPRVQRASSTGSNTSGGNTSLRDGRMESFDHQYQKPEFSRRRVGSVSSYSVERGSSTIPPEPLPLATRSVRKSSKRAQRKCYLCDKEIKLSRKRDWQIHLRDDLRPYQCIEETCSSDKQYTRLKFLREHYKQNHPTALLMLPPSYTCVFCEDELPIDILKRFEHIGSHLEDNAFSIVPCQQEDWKFYSDTSSNDEANNTIPFQVPPPRSKLDPPRRTKPSMKFCTPRYHIDGGPSLLREREPLMAPRARDRMPVGRRRPRHVALPGDATCDGTPHRDTTVFGKAMISVRKWFLHRPKIRALPPSKPSIVLPAKLDTNSISPPRRQSQVPPRRQAHFNVEPFVGPPILAISQGSHLSGTVELSLDLHAANPGCVDEIGVAEAQKASLEDDLAVPAADPFLRVNTCFAEEFDQDHVPEWRDRYFDYKTGKRLIKALQRAVNRTQGVSDPRNFFAGALASHRDGYRTTRRIDDEDAISLQRNAASFALGNDATTATESLQNSVASASITTRGSENSIGNAVSTMGNTLYDDPSRQTRVAFATNEHDALPLANIQSTSSRGDSLRNSLQPLAIPAEPVIKKMGATAAAAKHRAAETPKPGGLRRFPTEFNFTRVATTKIESHTHPIEMLNLREQEIMTFLDSELDKVDNFFQQKEKEAGMRLDALREQLHIMRHRRHEELRGTRFSIEDQDGATKARRASLKARLVRVRSTSKALPNLPFTPVKGKSDTKSHECSDFARKPIENTQISYRTAKQKLRVAVQEYYRELEYLKSYSILNRTAFRKLNKKYDRTLNPHARPTFLWFNENVDSSHFVNSNLIEEYLEAAEDLYTRYFERGNQKLAVAKLREITRPHGDKSESALINGLLVGIGLVFAVEGVWDGIEKLDSDDEETREQTVFLLQIYAGYFLMLYLFTLFCACCRIWTAYKVNYPFVFEFDTRHDLDWRQLSNFPCIFWLLFGVAIWINFAKWWNFGREVLFLWYPLILVGVTLIIIFLPLPVLRWRSRKWFAIAHWRLLCSGLYPVEFRDFFLGDMYCSLIYAVANAELFFCLYITGWDEPKECGSGFSRLMGALAAVPPFWRAMQCIRRFIDTRNAFPHLANLAKYVLTIGVAIILAMYRIDNDWVEREIYIFLAVISALYASFWDIFMDFSLLQEGAKYPGLRNVLAFDMPWMYYSILVIDPLLRFGWIPLVIFTHNLQRATIVAFIVAFTEVTRRGLWTLFRVENEHCTNIGHLKASRIVPLPYKFIRNKDDVEKEEHSSAIEMHPVPTAGEQGHVKHGADTPLIETGQTNAAAHKFKKAGTLVAISKMLAEAHKQDFQKKKRGTEDDLEQGTLGGARRDHGIERALQEDEDSDGELEEIVDDDDSATVRVLEREVSNTESIDNIMMDQEDITASPRSTMRSGNETANPVNT